MLVARKVPDLRAAGRCAVYVLFAILVSLLLYAVVLLTLRLAHRSTVQSRGVALGSLITVVAGLVLFNLSSRAVGIDLGPLRAVSYSIPDDYLARSAQGVLALIPYALACLSPALVLALLGRRR